MHKREERDIDGSGDGDLDIIRRSSDESEFPRSQESQDAHNENKDAEVFDEKLIQRSRSKENLEDAYEGSGEPQVEDESLKTILTPEEDPFTKDLEPEIVKKLLGVESSTKRLDDDNSQDNTLNVLPNVKDSIESVEEGDEGSGDEEEAKEIAEKVDEMPENEIIDEEEEKTEEERLNSYILEKPLGEITTGEETTMEPTTEVEEIVEVTTEAETVLEPVTEEEEIIERTTEVDEIVELTTEIEEIEETTTDDIIEIITKIEETTLEEVTEETTTEELVITSTTVSTSALEPELEIATTEEYVEDSTTEEATTESFLNTTEDYSISNTTEFFPENTSTIAIDTLHMAMDTLSDGDRNVATAGEPKRLGAYIVIGLILLSFFSLIGYIALRKRITKRRKEFENNQDPKDTEKALLSLTEYKDHPDTEENNIKNNEITPIVIQNSQRNKFEKNTNFSSPKNLNTNANEKTIEKDNVLKSTSDNLTQVIIEDSGKEMDEEKENIPNTEKLIVRTHLDQDSIPKRAIIVNRTSGGYLPVSQDNNM